MSVSPAVASNRVELARLRDALQGEVAVVMTMGALHEGHGQLIRAARARGDSVIVTIFLNPLQFAPGEDLDRYPKTFESDLALCTREQVDVIFAPTPDVIYPDGEPEVRVAAGPLGDRLEGEHRPGHFDGVLTVVGKLLHLTRPDVAFFGEKDAQPLALSRRLVCDLDFPVEVVGWPTVREPAGLALSSRNMYLSDRDRAAALSLNQALHAGAAAGRGGPRAVLDASGGVLAADPGIAVDSVALVDEQTWADADADTVRARLLVAARVGTTRLIDNVSIDLGTLAG